jgi:hypothetical protein
MQNRPTATVEPPSLGNAATEAFRIADVKLGATGFLDNLGKLITDISTSATVPPALNATDLRLKTLEEAIQTATAVSREPITNNLGQAGPSTTGLTPQQQQQQTSPPPPPPQPQQQQEVPAPAAQPATEATQTQPQPQPQTLASPQQPTVPGELSKHQLEKQQVIDAYNAAVAAAKSKYEEERSAATQHLHTLSAYPLESDKVVRRSFANVKPLETGEGAEVVTEREDGSTAAATAAAAAVPAGEVVVRVAIHLPQAPAYVGEEWLVLGSQTLVELRDSLYCLMEANIKNVEKDENARRSTTAPLSLSQPSSYFYIEGSFFIDTRGNTSSTSDTNDISEGIRRYLKQVDVRAPPHPVPGPASRPLGPFTTDYSVASMEERVFEDLWVRLGVGAAGLFCHQGGCEHLLVFLDVRAHDPAIDPPLMSQYPYKIADPGAAVRRKRECEACGLKFARKVTYEDRSAPHTPYFWCEDCYGAMHYDENGTALYTDFRVFPYEADYNPMILHEKSGVGSASMLRRE